MTAPALTSAGIIYSGIELSIGVSFSLDKSIDFLSLFIGSIENEPSVRTYLEKSSLI
jgi:hypothetical protein